MQARTRNILLSIPLILSFGLIVTNSIIHKGLIFCEKCWPSINLDSSNVGMNWHTVWTIADYAFLQLPTSIIHTYTRNAEIGSILRSVGVEDVTYWGAFDLALGVAFVLCSLKLLCILYSRNRPLVPQLANHKIKISILLVVIILLDRAKHNPFVLVGLVVSVLVIVALVIWGKKSGSGGGGSSGVLEDLKNIKINIGGS